MPRHRSLTHLCVDLLVFVSMFALMGHLSMNFWERFIIQKELTNMKSSLHSLKETINQIGFAYDGLHRELTGLAEKTEQNASPPSILSKRELGPLQSKKSQHLDKRIYDVEDTIIRKDRTTSTRPVLANKTAQFFIHNVKNKSTQFTQPEKRKITKSASTMTKYPVRSTAVGYESDRPDFYKNRKSDNQMPECCKDHRYRKSYENWKF